MAAPIAAFAQLPTDSGNTGKKMRTQTRVIGADTVHEHFFIESSTRDMLGSYVAHSGVFTIQATAQTSDRVYVRHQPGGQHAQDGPDRH